MKFSKLLMYKVVEFRGGIVIIAQHDQLQQAEAVPLIVGHSDDVAEYLVRYMHARENGKEIVEAHRISLKGAKIVEAGHLDTPISHVFDGGEPN